MNQSRAYVGRTACDEDALTSFLHAIRDDPTPIVNTSRDLDWIGLSPGFFLHRQERLFEMVRSARLNRLHETLVPGVPPDLLFRHYF